MEKIKTTQIKNLLSYDIFNGSFWISRNNKQKQISPKEDGYLYFFSNGKRHKLKANKLAYELGNKVEVENGFVVFHKNMDKNDYRLCNLRLLSSSIVNQINEAHRNLCGDLRISPHKQDMFSYVVTWVSSGQTRHKVCHDIVSARQFYLSLQLKFAKLMGKYVVFDN